MHGIVPRSVVAADAVNPHADVKAANRQLATGAMVITAVEGDWAPRVPGTPRLFDALVSVACEVMPQMGVGTHTIVIGRVPEALADPRQRPLVDADREVLHLTATTP